LKVEECEEIGEDAIQIKKECNFNLNIAIDYTITNNKKFDSAESLHTSNFEKNQYIDAIKKIGKIY